jgi:Rps23 Pro-64 3,4-dihydroxylase Tpa1-like proline 4-hydroxylase
MNNHSVAFEPGIAGPEGFVNPDLDIGAAAEEYRDCGRVFIRDFISPPVAEELWACMAESLPWTLYSSARQADVPDHALATLSPQEQQALIPKRTFNYIGDYRGVHNRFQMNKSMAEGRHVPPPLIRAYEAVNSPAYLDLMKTITGSTDAVSVSCAVSWYRPGHFCMAHTDQTGDDTRICAHVINMSKNWQRRWGGLLTFCDAWGQVLETEVPTFNTLALVRVPTWHYVSEVAADAAESRFALYGWVKNIADDWRVA